jgi:peptidoglycan-N-acetylglucosamine deacetylase
MSARQKPKASLSLDLDNQWSYMKTHGDAGWETFPSYLDVLIPRVLDVLAKHKLTITFFIVGQDAALDKNGNALAKITRAGHETGNHSFHHEPWLHLYSPEQIESELSRAEQAIEAATGARPNGFRGPGFSLSPAVLDTLKRRDYRYDASTFPTFLGPLARAYYFFTARLTKEEREKRRMLFGSWSEGLRPLKPYIWDLKGGPLLEIPVTTIPAARVPFHLSYILYLAGYSPALARTYFKNALRMCRLTGVEPSILLHPLDFLGGDDVDALRFFPAMQMKARDKLALVDKVFADLRAQFDVLPMSAHAEAIKARGWLKTVQPKFTFAQTAENVIGAAA